ncbi:MAG: IS110 family transposase [Oscillospiraceae bacterium]|nr:IS110 family transposase [Oscillospiraceae bacterium]
MNKSQDAKFHAIETTDAIVGIDIAKNTHWAVIISPLGKVITKPFSFNNNKKGFKSLVENVKTSLIPMRFNNVIIGMEPTGHYWKCLARYLKEIEWIKVVTVNPKHVKDSKELDDNCQTKSDRKDCITIARIVKDARYFEPYLPEGIWAELRNMSNTRQEIVRKSISVKCRIIATIDEYFPEYIKVFKKIDSRTSMEILKECPFPEDIKLKGKEGLLMHIKQTVKRGYSRQQVIDIYDVAVDSIGTTEGIKTAKVQLDIYVEEQELLEKQIRRIEEQLEELLQETGYCENMISIKGIGIVSAAQLIGELGDLTRFKSYEQIRRYAGLNLVENSSGIHQGKTSISRRGRSTLRSILYRIAFTMVNQNEEMKQLYKYLKERKNNPLKSKQALIAVIGKVLQIIYTIVINNTKYEATRVFNLERLEQLKVA